MAYLVLARKYRPRQFNQMMGQSHVLQALYNALTQQRLHHAYLFTGTRGVGKTTVARIFAKCLNCEVGISATPCDQCSVCQEIDQGRHLDLLEIDAASRTKVEDTRELLDNVQYNPQRGRFKIYLIDEVHMLSGHSFNALLKTLEEPPPHVKFLLATTDPQRLPVTVLSRCLQFHLKNMLPDQIVGQLSNVLTQEQLTADAEALMLIAQAAQGSMRDALSILDQAIAYGGGKITSETVSAMLGLAPTAQIIELLTLLAQKNGTALLKKIDTLAEMGADFLSVLNHLLQWFHQIALTQLLKENSNETLHALAQQFSAEDIQLYYQIALIGKKDLPFAPDAQIGFSMIIIRMLAFTPASTINQISPAAAPAITTPVVPATLGQPLAPTSHKNNGPDVWPRLLAKLSLVGITKLLAENCVLVKHSAEQFELCLPQNQAALLTAASKTRLIEALKLHLGDACQITIDVGKSSQESPAQIQERLTQQKLAQAQQQVLNQPQIQTFMEKFSATLQPESVIMHE